MALHQVNIDPRRISERELTALPMTLRRRLCALQEIKVHMHFDRTHEETQASGVEQLVYDTKQFVDPGLQRPGLWSLSSLDVTDIGRRLPDMVLMVLSKHILPDSPGLQSCTIQNLNQTATLSFPQYLSQSKVSGG